RLDPRQLKQRDWLMLSIGSVVALSLLVVATLVTRDQEVPLKPQVAKITSPWIPDTVKRWEGPIVEMAKKYDMDPNLLAIIMTLESGGYSQAESEIGAKGLLQITPPTAGDIAAKHLKEPVETYDLSDPRTNIEFGAAYLAYLREEFGEQSQAPSWNATVELIAAGYNGGPGTAGKLYRGEGITNTEAVAYSRDAYNMWRERHANTSPTYDRWFERGGSRLIEKANSER
ncbi:MAG TPA: transglycosylase SLT domain-containing protein, partial [Candidatus Saccharimonadales bacterium]